jgi:glycosyltransferase involved in cell wall biosynthesis
MTTEKRRSLKIGYIWQSVTTEKPLTKITATALHMRSVIDAFRKRGHQVRIISFANGQPHWSDDGITWQNIPPAKKPFLLRVIESVVRRVQGRLNLPYFNIFDSYRFSDACVAAAADIDVFYERFWILASGGLIAAKRLGIPIIYEVNGDIVEEYHLRGNRLPRLHWSAIHLVTEQMFKYAGKVIAVNDVLMKRLSVQYHLRPAKICVIDNGARVDQFAQVEKTTSDIFVSKYELLGNVKIIFVGTFKPWHGLDLLINAFGAVAGIHPSVKLILVGNGPLLSDIKKQVQDNGLEAKVIFTDSVAPDVVPSLLSVADIAVLNPRVSGASAAQSPLKLFEYMAAGKAIVAPKIDYVEKILTDRESALLVTPDDVEALKCSLMELVENEQLRQRLGQSAQQKALQQHSWEQVAVKIENIMYTLIESSLPGKAG